MKFLTIAGAISATAGVVASAQPHRHHHHQHAQKRSPVPEPQDVVTIDVPETVYVCNFEGMTIDYDECQEGINNGTFITSSGGELVEASSSSPSSVAPAPTSSSVVISVASSSSVAPAASAPVVQNLVAQHAAPLSTSHSVAPTSAPYSAPKHVATSSAPAPAQTSSTFVSSGNGVNSAFPNGQISCSSFPSQYGAINVDWVGLGGWTGVQNPRSQLAAGFSDIETATSGTCSGANCCTEGAYCSYACPPGYQKSQWPTMQGSTGQSVGGLLCQNGMLHLTNAALSNNLCIPGSQEVTVLVQNTMSQQAAVCRTDYPGTEGETVPLDAQPGTTQNLTMPSSEDYYQWQGKGTSAQYYVNPAGTSVSDGCQWGSPNGNLGNYAPLNLGVGYSNGMAWLSIFQNAPTTNAKLDFTIELVGDNMIGNCKYSNGQYCSGANYENCSPTTGCTVSTTYLDVVIDKL